MTVNQDRISNLFGLEGKTALVTGAATGIGRAIAELFYAAGAQVIGADFNEEALATLPTQCPGAITVVFDQAKPESIVALFEAVDKQCDTLDILINCAAIYPFKSFEEVDTSLIDRMLDVNLRGPFQCAQQAVKRMKVDNRGGSIVNIASVGSLKACIYDNVHYGVGKSGVNNLTISLALEYAEHNIRINSVLPGAVDTDHARTAAAEHTPRGPFTQPGRIPLTGTGCSPNEIANACLFLCSNAASYVTGQLLAVDGGFLIS